MEQSQILVVDDDREIAGALKKLLQEGGYRVTTALDGLEALAILETSQVHLLILDIMMPRMDGLSTLMKLRSDRNIPVILLSAKSEDSDKILGLSMGADDYITKPFNPQELLARVRSQLRRYLQLGGGRGGPYNPGRLVSGGLSLDTAEKQLWVDGEPVRLTATEYRILKFLMEHPGIVFSAEQIYESVWPEPAHAVENTVMVHIRRIREKIEINPREPKYLKVVWGIGYKIEKYL